METFKKFFDWLKPKPLWLKSVIMLLIAIFIVLLTMSCGTPKTVATVQNVNPNSTVTVTMSVSNTTTPSTDVTATPSVSFSKDK